MKDADWQSIVDLLSSCAEKMRLIQESVSDLLGDGASFFRSSSLRPPTRGCAELVFLRSIFWLQGLFHECAGRPMRFCLRQTQFSDHDGLSKAFLEEIKALRTQAAHNLDVNSESDKRIEFTCKRWYTRICHNAAPVADPEWTACTRATLRGAGTVLERVDVFLAKLRTMDNSDMLTAELKRAIAGQISPYAFDEIIESVAADLGRPNIDVPKFRSEHQKSWIGSLERCGEGYNFVYEATRLVEQSFLEKPERAPLTGRDVIEALGVPQGKKVAKMLALAQQIFESGTLEKHEIISELRKRLDLDTRVGSNA
jgi:hypothetical protein